MAAIAPQSAVPGPAGPSGSNGAAGAQGPPGSNADATAAIAVHAAVATGVHGIPNTAQLATLAGNRVAALGDSITIGGTPADNTSRADWLMWAAHLSDSRIIHHRNAGVGGNNSSQMLARVQADVIAYAPDWCVVMSGTNDASNGISLATYRSNITAIVAALRAAGISVVLCVPPPNPAAGGQRAMTAQYAAWVRAYALRERIPLVDVRAGLMDPLTGGWQAAYDSGDGIHPNEAGKMRIGQLVAEQLVKFLPVYIPHVADYATVDSLNMIPNALFLVDTNADGVPDSWSKTGSGTASIVTGDPAIKGNWLRLNDTVNRFTSLGLASTLTTGWAVGDRLAFSGVARFDMNGGQASVFAYTAGSNKNYRAYQNVPIAAAPGRFYMEFVVPAGTTAVTAGMQIQSGTSLDARIAQLSLINLTALGV